MTELRYLVIEGNIGAGKTTFSSMLSDELNARLVLEQFADNPFLPKFYADQERYSFPLELSFLADRYNQIKKEVLQPELFRSLMISDYYFTKSAIFARNTLQEDEYRLFRRLFNIVFESLPKPDLYVYLYLDIDHLMQNIRKRGRDFEQEMDPAYLEKIQNGYFEYFRQGTNFPVLIIDTNRIDFVNNPEHYTLLKKAILENDHKPGVTRMILP